MPRSGTVFGVGVGPGDPELMTVKAVQVVASARVVAYFSKRGKRGNAYQIAARHIHPEAEQLPLIYPYTTELSPLHADYIEALRGFYDDSAGAIAQRLRAGSDVAVLCEGDPMFYGSYMYLHDRLAAGYECRVIPGITSFAGCAARAGIALVSTDRTFTVVPGTLAEDALEARLHGSEAVVIIKLGNHFGKVRRVLQRLGRLESATYFEHGTTEREVVVPLADKLDDQAPYFSLIVAPAHDGGPYRPRGALA
jgi:precorrin-2/cobalt-factor-2 C20-methyltransferase